MSSTYFDSGDTGLGGLANTAGSLIAFLDKCLVNGYNSQTLTSLTSSGLVATATLTAHGFREGQRVTISGATPAGYNGTFDIIVGSVSANTFQYAIASTLTSPATGTINCIVASLGWTKPFSGTNLAAYKQPAGNALYLRIDDTGTTSARAIGYETMTDVNTGTNLFPTAVQLASGVFWSKASAAGPRRTILWGNQTCFWWFTDYTGDSLNGCLAFYGDGVSFKTGDVWFTTLIGQSAAAAAEGSQVFGASTGGSNYVALASHYTARSYTQIAGAITCNKIADERFSTVNGTGSGYQIGGANGTFPYPSPVDGNLWNSTLTIQETTATTPRGTLPGSYAPLHNKPLTNYTIYDGAGNLVSKRLMAINMGASGQLLAEVSNSF